MSRKDSIKAGSQGGFTLLELLIAISIFAVLSVMAYSGLRSIINTSQHTRIATQRFSAVQKLFLLMSQDLLLAANRSVRDELGDATPAFDAGLSDRAVLFSLTRSGMPMQPSVQPAMQRVSYHLVNGELHRLVWPVLDRVQSTEARSVMLLSDVQSVELAFLGQDNWTDHWPAAVMANTSALMPRAVSINLNIAGVGEVRRILPLTL